MPAQFTSTSRRGRSPIERADGTRRRARRARARRGRESRLRARSLDFAARRAGDGDDARRSAASASRDARADAARAADDERDRAREHVVAERRGDGAPHRARAGEQRVARRQSRGNGATAPKPGRCERRGGVRVPRRGERIVAARPCRATNAPSKQSPAPVASTVATRCAGDRARARWPSRNDAPVARRASARRPARRARGTRR